jgi:tripartite-type tricarboxylate transporter receptor subunit TctC
LGLGLKDAPTIAPERGCVRSKVSFGEAMLNRRLCLSVCATGLLATAWPRTAAFAQVVDKPLRIVVGFQPGGSLDTFARVLTQAIKDYATTIIVDNKPGAAGRIALEAIKASAPDGTSVILTPAATLVLNPHIYKTLAYDPINDFAPVTSVGFVGFDLAVGPKVPERVTALRDFVDWCKANPNDATYGSPGAGSGHQFVGTMFARAAGINLVHIPYRGAAPAIQDVLAGQIASNISVGAHLPLYREGKLRILAYAGWRRSPFLSDVPTFVEAGYDVVASDWFGVVAPAATPPPVVLRLNAAIRAAITSQSMQDAMARLGNVPGGESPDAFAAMIRTDLAAWGAIVRASGFTAED